LPDKSLQSGVPDKIRLCQRAILPAAEKAENRGFCPLVIRLPNKSRLINATRRLQIEFRDPYIFSRNFDVLIILQRKRYRLAHSQRSLVGHIDPDAAEIGQTAVFGAVTGRNRRNSFEIFRRNFLLIGGMRFNSRGRRWSGRPILCES